MSPEQINIAIAKACGWKRLPSIGIARYQPWCHESDDEGDDLRTDTQLPNYHGDLNAMHEAEKVFDDDESLWHKYAHRLYAIIEMRRHPIHATSAQRAEAFLRTLNLWTP